MNRENINILIAEDNEQFSEGIRLILRKFPKYCVLDVCRNGQELLDSSFLITADLILTDIEMPVLNGINAAKRINILYPEKPIIAITMHTEMVYLEDLILTGFRGFVHKPDIAVHLIEVIEKVLNKNFVFPYNLKLKK